MYPEWEQPALIPALDEGAIQVWRLDLHGMDRAAVVSHALTLLAPSELDRADRMRLGTSRDEFIAGRALLRSLLRNVRPEAASHEFSAGPNGKPTLSLRGYPEFNLSHSRGLVVAAISRCGPVGVDVEFFDSNFAAPAELLQIARENFFPTEVRKIFAEKSFEEQLLEFYKVWTVREAAAKASGNGIGKPQVPFSKRKENDSGGPIQRLNLSKSGDEQFLVRSVTFAQNYAGALAASPSSNEPKFLTASLNHLQST